ncbi:MAG TPA: ATP-binding cassette domain-containing protein [Thermoanaerobaculia bacterium]|nr:ATP-binding cassette domain-containing protein [Thermoanaerobaculia bacterium]
MDDVEVPWPQLERALPSLGPAVLRLGEPDAGYLVLLRRRGRRMVALTPNGQRRRVGTSRLAAALVWAAGERQAARVDDLLGTLELRPGRQRRAREALLAAQLAGGPGLEAHVLTVAGDQPIARQLREARAVPLAAAWLLAVAAWQIVALASWYLLGRGVLDGGLARGWLWAWALLLATQGAAQGAELAAVAALGQRVALSLRRRLFAAFVELAPDRLRGEGTGRLLGRVLATEAVERLSLRAGPAALVAAAELAAATGVLAHGAAAVAHCALLALAVAGVAVLAATHLRGCRDCAAARLALTDRMVEAVAGHRTRVVQGTAEGDGDEDAALAGHHALAARLGRRETWLRTGLPRAWLLAGLGALAPAGGGTAATPGRLAASLGGLLLAQAGLRRLAFAVRDVSGGLAATAQVWPILGGCSGGAWRCASSFGSGGSGVERSLAAAPRLLEARGLECRLAGGQRSVLVGVSVEVRSGERLVLDGPSGAGKSTFAAALAGQRRADSGLLLLWGLDLATVGREGWRRRVVAVPQLHDNHLFADTLAFNLLAGRGWPPTNGDVVEAEALCRELGLGELLDRLPGGLGERIGEAGWQLSDGEASRVCLARALLQKADLVVLDESLAALDPETRLRVLAVVGRRAGALVLIEHLRGSWRRETTLARRRPGGQASSLQCGERR